MPVQIGQKAPDFTLYSSEKEPWTLSEQDRPTVLLFFPGAFTSVCTEEMCTVNDDLARYHALNANVVGISTDSPATLGVFKEQHGLEFPLLSDHDAEVSADYDAKVDPNKHPLGYGRLAMRASFVIDENQVVKYADVLANPLRQPDFDAIQTALAA